MEWIGWYLGIFVMAATPWLELIVVIPIGIGAGLHPVPVAIVSFLGNALPVLLIIYGMDWIRKRQWYQRFVQKRKDKADTKWENADPKKLAKKEKRQERMKRIFDKYGIPGIALAGPGITGIHLATALAMGFQGGRKQIVLWMNVSLAIWTIAMTIASVTGIDWLMRWFG